MITSSLLVPLITACGTILAAILTGFGAAALKRRWDEAADLARWKREREERRRDELRVALERYFLAERRIEEIGNKWWANSEDRKLHMDLKGALKGLGITAQGDDESIDTLLAAAGGSDADFLAGTNLTFWSDYAALREGAAAGDLLDMLIGVEAAAPFLDHMQGMREWVITMRGTEDGPGPIEKAPSAVALKELAHALLS